MSALPTVTAQRQTITDYELDVQAMIQELPDKSVFAVCYFDSIEAEFGMGDNIIITFKKGDRFLVFEHSSYKHDDTALITEDWPDKVSFESVLFDFQGTPTEPIKVEDLMPAVVYISEDME